MTLHRAMLLLRALRDAESGGLQAGELARATSAHRVSVHRLLKSLDREGLVERDDVPSAKSCDSTSATFRPRWAASAAVQLP